MPPMFPPGAGGPPPGPPPPSFGGAGMPLPAGPGGPMPGPPGPMGMPGLGGAAPGQPGPQDFAAGIAPIMGQGLQQAQSMLLEQAIQGAILAAQTASPAQLSAQTSPLPPGPPPLGA